MTAANSTDTKGFFRSLYDFRFTSLIGARFLKFVYAVLVVVMSIATVVLILSAISRDNGGAIAVVVAVSYFLYLIWLRIFMEFLIVFFQIGADVHAVRGGGFEPGHTYETPRNAIPHLAAATPTLTDSKPPEVKPAAGWFEAPGDPTRYRYWDGSGWTEQFAPKGGPG